MLTRLARFGNSRPKISTLPAAAFGATLHKTVEEDDFDRQPLAKAERFLFAADIRIGNRSEVAAALEIDSRNLADAEIFFEAWLRWGDVTLDRIVGDFAFALFDAAERTLLLGRDPLGQRPLFYTTAKDFTAFASMPNGLLGGRGVSNALDHQSLARNMSDMPAAEDRSLFSHIRKVRPGHIVSIKDGSVTSRNYWQPGYHDGSSQHSSDYLEAYRDALRQAVSSALRGRTRRIATHVTSGLDSNSVACAAVEIAGASNIIGLTAAPPSDIQLVSPEGRFPDESRLAADVAAHLGIRQLTVRATGSAIAHLRSQAALYQEPYRNNINCGWLTQLNLRARAEGCGIILTGEAGNLTINGGSLAILGDLLRLAHWRSWLAEASNARRQGGARWTGILMNSFGRRLPQFLIDFLEQQFGSAYSRRRFTFVRREAIDSYVSPALPLESEVGTSNSYIQRLSALRSADYGNYNKGMLAESGVDPRHPLLDRRAIEFSLKVPPTEFLLNGRSRSLARRALVGRLPQKILQMHERGYQGAGWQHQVSKAELFSMIEEIEGNSSVEAVLDVPRLKRTVDRWDRTDFSDPAQDLATTTFLTSALAGGLFVVEAERGFPSLTKAVTRKA